MSPYLPSGEVRGCRISGGLLSGELPGMLDGSLQGLVIACLFSEDSVGEVPN